MREMSLNKMLNVYPVEEMSQRVVGNIAQSRVGMGQGASGDEEKREENVAVR